MSTFVPPAADDRFFDRELSWLAFNARVLALAEDRRTPLLERCKFLAIFSQNLDEFFRVRVAGLKDQAAAGLATASVGGLSVTARLAAIIAEAHALTHRQASLFNDEIVPALAGAGIRMCSWDSLEDDGRKYLSGIFDEDVFPVLTPLSVDPGHPFPHISDLSLNLAVMVRDPESGDRRFARVKVPGLLPRFLMLPDGERFVPLESVIAAHLGALFPGMEVECQFPFRVTRNADMTGEDDRDADDLLAAVELELRRRRRGRAVRLEVDATMSQEIRALLRGELQLEDEDVLVLDGLLDLGGLWSVYGLDRPELRDGPLAPVTDPRLADGPVDVFAVVREGDVLLHHPYESFSTTVEAFVKQAARDPSVLAIKMTLYRTSPNSPIAKALIRAAQADKQVVAIVELKARFDEAANIAWARAMEEAGVHVVYGLVGLKTHCKVAMVARLEGDHVRRYCHIGTGNYNSDTARLYEDVGILTADPVVGADVAELFNFLTGYSRDVAYERLVLAPDRLAARVVELIVEQARPGGRIVLKMNSLVDRRVIEALYAASQAGASIDLIVRGMCSLRPGVPGLSESIQVRSILGRYLEHSRILCFGPPESDDATFLIGSADLMPRNLYTRVEAMVSLVDAESRARLAEVLEVCLADDVQAWTLEPDGSWRKVARREAAGAGIATHERLHQLAAARHGPVSTAGLAPDLDNDDEGEGLDLSRFADDEP